MECYKGYTELKSSKMKFIETTLLDTVKKEYKVREWDIPALIQGEILQKCGYFKTMPNQLTAVGYVKPEAIENIIQNNQIEEKDIANNGYYLTPAACIHLYPMITENPVYNEVITTKARVYRYENNRFECGRRLWDFGVREFVAVGDGNFVKGFLEFLKERALELTGELGIEAHIENSNDHFYPTRKNETMQKMQKVNGLKKELVATQEQLAIASFNYHDFHFSKAFNFDDNKKIVTGCVGFGLDRWIYVLNKGGVE